MIMEEAPFLQLIDQHQGIIHKICRLYRDSPEDREDLFQDIVFQLWKNAPAFEGRSKFSTWMYRVALSAAISA
jgi:RNA polymerase sigma factor (sigma-70 family)